MTGSERFRFGKIKPSDGQLPSPKELHKAIDRQPQVRDKKSVVKGEDPVELMEMGMNSYYSDRHDDHSFCQFTYVGTRGDSAPHWDGDEIQTQADSRPVRPLVYYFKNGQFAYTPETPLAQGWIPNFIGSKTSVGESVDREFSSYTSDDMQSFYENHEYVSKLKFGAAGDGQLDDSSEVTRALNELAEKTSSQEFSGGDVNLKGITIFDEAAKNMDVMKIRLGPYGERRTILSTGMYEARWNDDPNTDQEARAEAIYQDISTELRRLE